MTRFTAPDLARLPPLDFGSQDFETIRLARLADLTARLKAVGIPYTVSTLETDALSAINRAGTYREVLALARRDDGVRAVLLATSWGPFLDHLAATQVPPVVRKPLVASPRGNAVSFPADWEGDDDFRARIQAAPETLSTCGPEGAYREFALAVPGVKAISVYGPMSFGGTPANPFTPLGTVRVAVVAQAGDGTASAGLCAAVAAALTASERRPMADFVTVTPAIIVPYTVVARLYVGAGADAELLRLQAQSRLEYQTRNQHKPGAAMLLQQLYAAAYVPAANGVSLVTRVAFEPAPQDDAPFTDVNAAPILPGSDGGAYRAPYCTGVTTIVEVVND